MKPIAFITVFSCLLIACLPARAALELKEGDSIIVVGNTFAERIALSGYLDAMIHAANPDKKIEIRSVPNSADEVDDRPRERSVPTEEFYLKRHGADVVIMCYGMSESFDGLEGANKFRDDLAKRVDTHLAAKYNGASAPKIVLVSPIAHEDLGNPNLPTGGAVKERNTVLQMYAEAMESVANDKNLVFIDLFTPSTKMQGKARPLTNNGIAPTEYGCFVYAGEIAKQLGWWDGKTAADSGNADEFRQTAYDKHYHWRHRYRPTNTEYVHGRRHKPFGIVNFPPELDHLDKMVATREKALHEMDKPTLGQLFAKAPGEKAIWETTPLTYDFPGDNWPGVEIPGKDIANDNKAGDASGIADPDEYIKTFKVAEGYQVNLFACEEMFKDENGVGLLANPLGMSFDFKGRLWVLCSPTYPHPYPGEVTDCRILILDDTDNDGKADKCTVFARHMNIPTCFVIDGNGVAYVGQAPDLWKLTDTDGDDVADRKEIVYSGFGMPDSHHTISSSTWDPNGGIVMLEGVFTKTNIETPYGTQRTRDAAVWRFDPRTHKLIAVSHTSHPNPWGITYDKYGQSILMDTSGSNQYNFNSLISPYVGFEKPQKGPPVVKRGRPTAGSDIIDSAHWPEEMQGVYVHSQCIGFLGTHLDKLKTDGAKNSGYFSEPMPEPILSSSIGNYRPVCSEIGQDGALYIADWVNPLIGHMQFNLRDPRRDHDHGRIYRVTHKERPVLEKIDLTKLDIAGLLDVIKTTTEGNTRDRARRLLQTMDKDAVIAATNTWVFEELDPRAREYDYELMVLEAVWIQQAHGVYDVKLIDEATRAREPMVLAGVIRAIRYGLQYEDVEPADAESFIARAVTDRDMRVRLEAVMACAYLKSSKGVQLANLVTTQEMDGPIRTAHAQTIKYLKNLGFDGKQALLLEYYTKEADDLVALSKKKVTLTHP
ncbi:MAG: PVC-type heme-binding CxxCH protein [Planctomycetota bacterium]